MNKANVLVLHIGCAGPPDPVAGPLEAGVFVSLNYEYRITE